VLGFVADRPATRHECGNRGAVAYEDGEAVPLDLCLIAADVVDFHGVFFVWFCPSSGVDFVARIQERGSLASLFRKILLRVVFCLLVLSSAK
jgi:hypothetical protein